MVTLVVLRQSLTVAPRNLNAYEFPAGKRFIDILAVGADGAFVVVELKVSRGYERAKGQLLRYMAWVRNNLSNGATVRGAVVANEISDDLKLASSLVPNIQLVVYEISFPVRLIND